MIRIAVIVGVACLIFGVGGVLGAGGRLWNGTAKSLQSVATSQACEKTDDVVDISFSKTKYPHIKHHVEDAIEQGWPKVMAIHRAGADTRRDQRLRGVPTKDGQNRDEYPPAVLRSKVASDVELIPASENKSQGASLGIKIRRYCDGVRVRYIWY